MMKKNISLGIHPSSRDLFNDIYSMLSLPFIRGKWIDVDPLIGAANAAGTAENPFASIDQAYAVALPGDGIRLAGRGVSSAACTSYLTQPLVWAKNDITVVGLSAPTSVFQRSRISNKTKVTTGALTDISFTNSGTADYISRVTGSFVTDGFEAGQKIRVAANSGTNSGTFTILTVAALKITLSTGDSLTTEDAATAGSTTITNYLPYLVSVTGSNNTFTNISCFNSDVDVAAIGGWVVGGNRNYYANCHFVGGAGAAAVATAYSLKCDGAQDTTFDSCTFGTDSVDRGNYASCEILFDSTCYRLRFNDCVTLAHVSGGYTAHLAIKSADSSSINADIIFKDCLFNCFAENHGASQLLAFGGTAPTSGYFYMLNSFLAGYAAWDGGTNNCVYIGGGATTASGGGGIPTTV